MTEQDAWEAVYADYDDENLLNRLIDISCDVQYLKDKGRWAESPRERIAARELLTSTVKRQTAVKAEILKRMQNHDQ